jgi:hypothetical protein
MNIQSILEPKQLVTGVLTGTLTAGLAVGAIVLISNLTGPLPLAVSQTSTMKQSTFDTTGTSEVTTTPDEAQVSVGFTNTDPSVGKAQDDANKTVAAITDAIKKLGVTPENIKTTDYNVSPNYDYSPESTSYNKITGYTVSSTLTIKTKELEKLNNIIDAATANGANQVNGVSFSLSKDKSEELKKEAREEAIADAKENAEELSRLANMKLGKIINIYEYQQSPQPMMDFKAMSAVAPMGEAGGEPTNVQAGSTTYTYQVTLSYETL